MFDEKSCKARIWTGLSSGNGTWCCEQVRFCSESQTSQARDYMSMVREVGGAELRTRSMHSCLSQLRRWGCWLRGGCLLKSISTIGGVGLGDLYNGPSPPGAKGVALQSNILSNPVSLLYSDLFSNMIATWVIRIGGKWYPRYAVIAIESGRSCGSHSQLWQIVQEICIFPFHHEQCPMLETRTSFLRAHPLQTWLRRCPLVEKRCLTKIPVLYHHEGAD